MGLKKASKSHAISRMTAEERTKWNSSLCKNCEYFSHFLVEDSFDKFPVYYVCSAHNITGADFVKDAMQHYCSFCR